MNGNDAQSALEIIIDAANESVGAPVARPVGCMTKGMLATFSFLFVVGLAWAIIEGTARIVDACDRFVAKFSKPVRFW